MKLVIVESPTKAKTISRYLGKGFKVESSFGHVRDLPKSKLGVDTEKNFEPQYVIPTKAKKRVSELKKLAAKADEIYLATDEDREGEAIAWHLEQILKPKVPVKRIAFHEITKEALDNAMKNPREIAGHQVDAQQARRILDRLVGYELSPFLWRKVYRGLSAGRVQSVVVRLIVEREREIQAFNPEEYWTIEGIFTKEGVEFEAMLHSVDGKKLEKLGIKNEADAKKIVNDLDGAAFAISKIEQKERQRKPNPPFITSTLQQEANTKLGFSAKQTMMIAQQLYEGISIDGQSTGLITYMRTDSVNLADKFMGESESFINEAYGSEYSERKVFTKKSKGAQEAHEAIRPTDVNLVPEQIKAHLEPRQFKLYNLIWSRAVASQMSPAVIKATSVDIASGNYVMRATGSQIAFDGWLKIYTDKTKENILPALTEGENLDCKEIKPNQHFTEPPARYTEAAIVKALEERGIGRPSTYAPTIATVQDRGYVKKEDRKLVPEEVGFVVNDLLVEHFPQIVDYDFTAGMEETLDKIAEGEKEWQPVIKEFYEPFKKNLMEKDKEISKKDIAEEETDEICPKCGKPMVIKMGRYGKFLACTGYPDCKTTKPLDENGEPAPEEKSDVKCDKCGADMVQKHGRFGPFLGCSNYPDCKNIVNIEKTTGVKCPKCGKGDIIEKKSRRGKTFYACNKYPDCENAYWSKPTGEQCPDCSSLLVYAAKNTVRCSNKECKFQKEGEQSDE
ncbi:MAG: type I DNA topoisomerase [Candidatus Kerfeldbacteria bacterium]